MLNIQTYKWEGLSLASSYSLNYNIDVLFLGSLAMLIQTIFQMLFIIDASSRCQYHNTILLDTKHTNTLEGFSLASLYSLNYNIDVLFLASLAALIQTMLLTLFILDASSRCQYRNTILLDDKHTNKYVEGVSISSLFSLNGNNVV
jgi:hypothetical protein